MFNMLIAIMGDTFSQIMENRLVNATKSKLELMSDLSAVIGGKILGEDKKNFFFIVQPEIETDEVNFDEWEGTIKSIQKIINKSTSKINADSQRMQNKIDQNIKKAELQNFSMKKHIEQVVKKNAQEMQSSIDFSIKV